MTLNPNKFLPSSLIFRNLGQKYLNELDLQTAEPDQSYGVYAFSKRLPCLLKKLSASLMNAHLGTFQAQIWVFKQCKNQYLFGNRKSVSRPLEFHTSNNKTLKIYLCKQETRLLCKELAQETSKFHCHHTKHEEMLKPILLKYW